MMKKFKYTVKQFFNNIKQIKIDKETRKKYLEDISLEILNKDSKYNKYGLSSNEDYTCISYVTNIPENYQLAGTDIMKLGKLQEDVRPIMEYLINLGYGNYFTAPEFYYVETEDDDRDPNEVLSEVSCTYIVRWSYKPVLDMYPNFKWQLAGFIGINLCILALLIALPIILL